MRHSKCIIIEVINMPTIKFARLRDTARIPTKRFEDAGFDIYTDSPYQIIKPNETAMLPTGIISAFDPAWYIQLQERGSTGALGLAIRAGVIDSGFRGEWKVLITNHNDKPIYFVDDYNYEKIHNAGNGDGIILFSTNKAICQAIVLPVPECEIDVIGVQEIMSIASTRGDGMLGSSGK